MKTETWKKFENSLKNSPLGVSEMYDFRTTPFDDDEFLELTQLLFFLNVSLAPEEEAEPQSQLNGLISATLGSLFGRLIGLVRALEDSHAAQTTLEIELATHGAEKI